MCGIAGIMTATDALPETRLLDGFARALAHRGPDGQGHSATTGLPVAFGPDSHVGWKVRLPGKGWSTPIVDGGRVFLTTAVPSGETPPSAASDASISWSRARAARRG